MAFCKEYKWLSNFLSRSFLASCALWTCPWGHATLHPSSELLEPENGVELKLDTNVSPWLSLSLW
jgi:hypothetical protein